jgi:hypothetical protein
MKKLHKVALSPRGNKPHNLQKNVGSTSKKVLPKFELLAAPLEGYSEAAFRTLCHKYGAHKTVQNSVVCVLSYHPSMQRWLVCKLLQETIRVHGGEYLYLVRSLIPLLLT